MWQLTNTNLRGGHTLAVEPVIALMGIVTDQITLGWVQLPVVKEKLWNVAQFKNILFNFHDSFPLTQIVFRLSADFSFYICIYHTGPVWCVQQVLYGGQGQSKQGSAGPALVLI